MSINPVSPSVLVSRDYQQNLLAHMLRCPQLQALVLQGKVSEEDFDLPIHRCVIPGIRDILSTQSSLCGEVPRNEFCLVIRGYVQNGVLMSQEVPAMTAFVLFAYTTPLNEAFYLSTLPGYLAEKRTRAVHQNHQLQAMAPADYVNRLNHAFQSSQIGAPETRSVDQFVCTPQPDIIPVGIGSIDQGLGGGLAKKEAGLVCAPTGVGKTTMGVNFCWGGARMGFNCAMISLELSESKIMKRAWSLMGRYPYSLLMKGDPARIRSYEEIQREAYDQAMMSAGDRRRNFFVWDFSEQPVNIHTIRERLRQDRIRGITYDMVYIDWLDLMTLTEESRKESKKDDRQKLLQLAKDVVWLAKTENLAVWTATQSDAKGFDKDLIGLSNSSEAKGKSYGFSVFLGVGSSKENRRAGRYTVNFAKTRDDAGGYSCEIRAVLSEQRFEDWTEDTADQIASVGAPSATMMTIAEFDQANRNEAVNSMIPDHLRRPPQQ